MVVVDTVGTRFEAELLAAKLGANGILWEIRSRQLVPTTHPIGCLDVLVPVEEEAEARELLAPDEVLSTTLEDDGGAVEPAGVTLSPTVRVLRWALAIGLAVPVGVVLIAWLADLVEFLRTW